MATNKSFGMSPQMGQMKQGSPFGSFFGGQQGQFSGGPSGQQAFFNQMYQGPDFNQALGTNPQSIGGRIIDLAQQDYQKSNAAMRYQHERGLGVENQFSDLLGSLQGTHDQFAQNLQGVTDENVSDLRGLADSQMQEFRDMASGDLETAKGYFDEGLAETQSAIDDFGMAQTQVQANAAWASQKNFQDQRLRTMSDPGMTEGQKKQQLAQLDMRRQGDLQANVSALQAQTEQITLQARQQLGALHVQVGSAYGGLAQGYSGQLLQSQASKQAAYGATAAMRSETTNQIRASQMQVEQAKMAGLGGLAQMIQSNPLIFGNALPVGMLAANLGMLGQGLNPWQGTGGGQSIADKFPGMNKDYFAYQAGDKQGNRGTSEFARYPTWYRPPNAGVIGGGTA